MGCANRNCEVIVESDAQYVQENAVRVSEPDDSVFGDVIAAVKLVLDQHPSYRVVWVNPNVNIVAHNLAHIFLLSTRVRFIESRL